MVSLSLLVLKTHVGLKICPVHVFTVSARFRRKVTCNKRNKYLGQD